MHPSYNALGASCETQAQQRLARRIHTDNIWNSANSAALAELIAAGCSLTTKPSANYGTPATRRHLASNQQEETMDLSELKREVETVEERLTKVSEYL